MLYSEDSEDLSSTISPNSAIITGRTYFLDRYLLGNSASNSLICGSSDIEAHSYGLSLGNSALSGRCTSVFSESSSSKSWLISWIVFVRRSTNRPLHSEQLNTTNLPIRDDVG
ncbi:unnamed protein product [Rhizophagus irregularis]|nr:unnamed protein product [Rhizophagus irregularis]